MKEQDIIKQIETQIDNLDLSFKTEKTGIIQTVGDGVAVAIGLMDTAYGERVIIKTSDGEEIEGMAMDLREDEVGIIVLGRYEKIKEGDIVVSTNEILSVPIGMELLGRVVDGKGEPIDGKGKINAKETSEIEKVAPGVITRAGVNTSLATGITAIDSLIPIGTGQRELIIGDRNTGKTSIAIDTIINQKGKGVYCIYCAIGQKNSKISQIVAKLESAEAMKYTIIVNASSSDPVTEQYLAPYTAATIGEYFRDRKMDALVVYDDLTKHAWAYRQLSLILKRPSGREAYPGDVFYLHSRLLERAAKLKEENGGGSLSALPIIETQIGDISAYIPTNLISITDGQIYLESDLFYAGIRPAINIGLSVSRVGSKAQVRAMKQVAGRLKLDMAQYRELAAFSQFGSDLDENTKKLLTRGDRITQILKQKVYSPLPVEIQVLIIYSVTSGATDNIPVEKIEDFEVKLIENFESVHQDVLTEIREKKELSDELKEQMTNIISEFATNYV